MVKILGESDSKCMVALPETEASLWRHAYTTVLYSRLRSDLEVDVAVVGGGITGLTAAYLLKQAGLKVAVLEMRTVGSGTTGRTTGKVSSLHNLFYHDLQKRLGQKTARLYGEANQAAVELVRRIAREEGMDKVWQDADNYVYTTNPERVNLLKLEAQTAAQLGLPAEFVTATPLPFEVQGAVKFSGQGNIQAQEYVLGLARAVDGDGSHVFENSLVTGIHDGEPSRVRTDGGTVLARDVIVATNVPTLPLAARGTYCLLEYPTESYIVAGRLAKPFEGMYISPDDQHYSIFPFTRGKEQWLLVGGESNISGLRRSKEAKYRRLATYAARHFGVTDILYKWSDRDYQSYDGPPLAGRLYPWSAHVYVATAFRKWGLSNGTASAMILRDLILKQPNPWAEVYDPIRIGPIKNIPRIMDKYLADKL